MEPGCSRQSTGRVGVTEAARGVSEGTAVGVFAGLRVGARVVTAAKDGDGEDVRVGRGGSVSNAIGPGVAGRAVGGAAS